MHKEEGLSTLSDRPEALLAHSGSLSEVVVCDKFTADDALLQSKD